MFQSARLKLTAWLFYLLLCLVSITFSYAFIGSQHLKFNESLTEFIICKRQSTELLLPTPPEAITTLDQLETVKTRLENCINCYKTGLFFLLQVAPDIFLQEKP